MGFKDILSLPWVVGALTGLCGCAAELQNPQKYDTGTGLAIPACASDVLKLHCASRGCHDAETHVANLDLVSSGIVNRLVDKPATFGGLNPDSCPKPGSILLINTANPTESWMWKKVFSDVNNCGGGMPPGKPDALQGNEPKCFQDWILSFSTNKGGGVGGASATSATTMGNGGSSSL